MASRIITDKEERLAYIKECAANIRAEKARIAKLYEQDPEVLEQFGMDTDFLSIENIQGFVIEGMQKVSGGFRKIPVIIL